MAASHLVTVLSTHPQERLPRASLAPCSTARVGGALREPEPGNGFWGAREPRNTLSLQALTLTRPFPFRGWAPQPPAQVGHLMHLFWPVISPRQEEKIPKEPGEGRSSHTRLLPQILAFSFSFVSGTLPGSLPSPQRGQGSHFPFAPSFDFALEMLHPGPPCQNWLLIGSPLREGLEGWNNIQLN